METIRRSYHLFRQSLAILSQDKEILIFPLLSGILPVTPEVVGASAVGPAKWCNVDAIFAAQSLGFSELSHDL